MGSKSTSQAAALRPLIESFIAQKTTNGYSAATISIYRHWLHQLADAVPDVEALDSLALTKFLTRLRQRGVAPSTLHQCFRNCKTFIRWLSAAVGGLSHDPLAGTQVRVPKTLPDVPRPEELQALLDQCDTRKPVGLLTESKRRALMLHWRNRALILAMAESGLRRAEVLGLSIDDWNRGDRETLPSFRIRNGKGGRDRVSAAESLTASAITEYLRLRAVYAATDPLFASDDGRRLQGRSLAKILERLSAGAGLLRPRWIHPHSLRHFAGTSWLKFGVGLDQVRRQLGHASLSTTLIYSSLQPSDVQDAIRRASALERMGIK